MVKRLCGGWCTQGAHRAALILGQIRVYPERDWLRRQSTSHLIGQNHNLSLGHEFNMQALVQRAYTTCVSC